MAALLSPQVNCGSDVNVSPGQPGTPTASAITQMSGRSASNSSKGKSGQKTPKTPSADGNKISSRQGSQSPSTFSAPRTRSKSESDPSTSVVVVNSTFLKTPTSKSLLQSSLLKSAGVHSPLATSLSESEASDDSDASSKPKTKVIKSKCPCGTSSEGTSWLMTCRTCGQVWHSKCSNLDGLELSQAGIDSLLPQWDCPWCYVCSFPRPKGHKSTKLANTLQTTCYANQISADAIASLDGR